MGIETISTTENYILKKILSTSQKLQSNSNKLAYQSIITYCYN